MAKAKTDKADASDKRKRQAAPKANRAGFTPAQRAKFVELILKGSSFRNACKLVGCHHDTAYRWLNLGRAGGQGCTAAHKQFAKAYDEAEAQGTQALLDQMADHAVGDWRATKVLLDVRDQRFGVRRSVAKANLEKLQIEVEMARANARIAIAKADAAEAALKGGGQAAMMLGIEALLEAPGLDEKTKAALIEAMRAQNVNPIAPRDFESEARERGIE